MCASIATLVERDGVIALGGEEGQDSAPGVGEFGEAVDAEDEFGGCGGSVRGGKGFEDVEDETVGSGVNVAGCDARREVEGWEFFGVGSIRGGVLVCVCHLSGGGVV